MAVQQPADTPAARIPHQQQDCGNLDSDECRWDSADVYASGLSGTVVALLGALCANQA
jgi:hypothetical protein